MSERPALTVEYLEPVEAEPLPEKFSVGAITISSSHLITRIPQG